MPTMNVSLSAEFVAFVERAVASGDYSSASEVVRDGLRLLQREAAMADEKRQILQRELMRGVVQAQNGEFSPRTIGEIAAGVSSQFPDNA